MMNGCCFLCLVTSSLCSGEPVQAKPAYPFEAKSVSYWVTCLHSEDPLLQQKAIGTLEQLGPYTHTAVFALLDTLASTENPPPLRAAAARALAKVAFNAAVQGFGRSDLRPASIEALTAAAEDRHVAVRQGAIEALGNVAHLSKKTHSSLLKALQDDDPLVQQEAARSWRSFAIFHGKEMRRDVDIEEVTQALLAALRSSNEDVSWAVAQTLGALGSGGPQVVQELITAAANRTPAVASEAVRALGEIGVHAPNVVQVLIDATKRPDQQVSSAAVRAIAELLDKMRIYNPMVAPEVEKALAKIARTDADMVPRLIVAAKRPDQQVSLAAVKVLTAVGDADPRVTSAIIDTLRTHPDWVTRQAAVSALKSFGPSEAVAGALVCALLDQESQVRVLVKPALRGMEGHLGMDQMKDLLPIIHNQEYDAAVRADAIAALPLFRELVAVALPDLVDVIGSPDEFPNVSTQVATLLGEVPIPPSSKQKVVDALFDFLEREQTATYFSYTRAAAIQTLVKLDLEQIDKQRFVTKLRDELKSKRLVRVPEVAVQALGRLGPAAKDSTSDLVELLKQSTYGRRPIAEAIGRIGTPAVPDLVEELANTSLPPFARSNICEAIAEAGPQATAAIPCLVKALKDDRPIPQDPNRDDPRYATVRDGAAVALGKVTPGVQADIGIEYYDHLVTALKLLYKEDWPNLDRKVFEEGVVQPVRRAVSAVEAGRSLWRRNLLLGSSLLLLGLVLVGAFMPSIRRWIQVRLGQRWALEIRECEHEVFVRRLGNRIELELRSRENPVSNPPTFELPSDLQRPFPEDLPEFRRLRAAFRPLEMVRVDVEETLFDRPWSLFVGARWGSDRASIVAGQVTSAWTEPSRRPPMSKRIIFGLVVNDRPTSGLAPFRTTQDEVIEITRHLRSVRAELLRFQLPGQATVENLQRCLTSADIVHVTAHASPDWIDLQNGQFTCQHLEGLKVRCRLLVLRGCRLGDPFTEGHEALVVGLTKRGVNVLAATEEISDNVCPRFFGPFYRAFLPRRGSMGREVAAAVREASVECRAYYERLQAGGLQTDDWNKSIDSLVLYGDPSLHLSLAYSVRNKKAAGSRR